MRTIVVEVPEKCEDCTCLQDAMTSVDDMFKKKGECWRCEERTILFNRVDLGDGIDSCICKKCIIAHRIIYEKNKQIKERKFDRENEKRKKEWIKRRDKILENV